MQLVQSREWCADIYKVRKRVCNESEGQRCREIPFYFKTKRWTSNAWRVKPYKSFSQSHAHGKTLTGATNMRFVREARGKNAARDWNWKRSSWTLYFLTCPDSTQPARSTSQSKCNILVNNKSGSWIFKRSSKFKFHGYWMPELESGLSISMILSLSLIRYIIILIISTSNSHRKSFSCSAGKERPNFGYLPFIIIISSQNSCTVRYPQKRFWLSQSLVLVVLVTWLLF